jgi:hypothetical protein
MQLNHGQRLHAYLEHCEPTEGKNPSLKVRVRVSSDFSERYNVPIIRAEEDEQSIWSRVDSTLIKHSSAFIVTSVRIIKEIIMIVERSQNSFCVRVTQKLICVLCV